MSIQKKNGKYVPIVYCGKDPATGKEIRKWGSYHEKKKDAEKEHAQMILERDDLKKGYVFKDVTFETLYNQFYELVAKNKYTPYTLESYSSMVNREILPIFKHKLLKDIEPIHMQKYAHTLSKFSPATQRKIFYYLKTIFESAVKWQMIKYNPCIGVELSPMGRKQEKHTWTTEQVKRFLSWEYTKESLWYIAFEIAFSTGMRPGEVCGIRWDDINRNILRVTSGLDRKKRATDLKNQSSYNRKLPLDSHIVKLLKRHRIWQKENKLQYGISYYDSDYVITNFNGRPMSPNSFGQFFNRALKKYNDSVLEEEKLPVTDLYGATRHSFATNTIAMGVEASIVAYIMGHSTTQTTYDNYVHVRQKPIEETIQAFAKAIH